MTSKNSPPILSRIESNTLSNPSPAAVEELKDFVTRNRHAAFGTIEVDRPTFMNYVGPATNPRVEPVPLTQTQPIEQIQKTGDVPKGIHLRKKLQG